MQGPEKLIELWDYWFCSLHTLSSDEEYLNQKIIKVIVSWNRNNLEDWGKLNHWQPTWEIDFFLKLIFSYAPSSP